MINDGDRNAAYFAWLRWALAKKKKKQGTQPIRVLDIGAGSGLLGLMSARAAGELGMEVEVVCLEKVPVLAAAAGWAAEENGAAEVVTVVNELSSDVTAEDLGAWDLWLVRVGLSVCESEGNLAMDVSRSQPPPPLPNPNATRTQQAGALTSWSRRSSGTSR